MRRDEECQESFVVFASLDDCIPAHHPLRSIRRMVDEALREMSPLLSSLYAERGRLSIPPEYLLRAQVVQFLYAIPSERRLCEELAYNLLIRWFVGLPWGERVWHPTSFSKNRDRLLCGEVAQVFFEHIRGQADAQKLLSREHFSCDGTLLQAAASLKSFRPREEADGGPRGSGPQGGGGRNASVDFHGERRSNETYVSRTDPDARLCRIKGKEARLSYRGHLVVENRHGLIVASLATKATGRAEREAALALVKTEKERGRGHMTLAADKGYDTRDFVSALRTLGITPHVAAKRRFGAVDGRTTRHRSYALSQRRRKVVEEVFGWMKTVGGLDQLRHRGLAKVSAIFTFACAAFNLVRIKNLLAELSAA